MKRYYKITVDTPYAGTEEIILLVVNGETTESIISEYTEEKRMENAESYDYMVAGWDNEPEADELDDYYESCTGEYEEITADEYAELVDEGYEVEII